MWGWFGGQGAAQKRKDAPKKAILDLRQQLDMLQKRERHLENQMAQQDKVARENVTSNKTGMLFPVAVVKEEEAALGFGGRVRLLRKEPMKSSGLCQCIDDGEAGRVSLSRKHQGFTELTSLVSSRTERPQAEESARTLPGANDGPDQHARAADLQHRIRKHQPGDPRRHAKRRQSHEGDPRQDDHGGRGHDHVCPFSSSSPPGLLSFHYLYLLPHSPFSPNPPLE